MGRIHTIVFLALGLLLSLAPNVNAQEDGEFQEELHELRQRVEALEQRERQDGRQAGAEAPGTKGVSGFHIGAGITQVLQYVTDVDPDLSDEEHFLDATISADLEIEKEIGPRGTAFAAFEAGSGSGVDGILPTLSGFNADAVGDTALELLEGWYEESYKQELLRLRIGKIDVTSDFDTNSVANDETSQFLSPAFVNNLAVEFPEDNGFGGMLWFAPTKVFSLGFAVADAEADGHNLNHQMFYMVEVDLRPSMATGDGVYRLYWWKNTRPHAEFKDPDDDDNDGMGFGASIDQQIGKSMTLFGRLGFRDDAIYQLDQYLSVGLELDMGSSGDALAFAYGTGRVGDDYEDVYGHHEDERHVEVYYRYQHNKHVAFTPDLQWVNNPGGDEDNGNVTVLGLRAQITF